MATISPSSIASKEVGQSFSNLITTIIADLLVGSPATYEELVFTSWTANKLVPNVSLISSLIGDDLQISVSGTHTYDPFTNNKVTHIPRGSSDRVDTPIVSQSFPDKVERQVFKWQPDEGPVTVTFTVNYTADLVPESKQFTQQVTVDIDDFIPTFLESI